MCEACQTCERVLSRCCPRNSELSVDGNGNVVASGKYHGSLLEVAILIAAAAGTLLTALAIWQQNRWRQPLLNLDSTRSASSGPDSSVVSLVIRNDGEAAIPNLRAFAFVDGVELPPITPLGQGESLGRDRMRQFDVALALSTNALADKKPPIQSARILPSR